MKIRKVIFLVLYYGLAKYLPNSYTPVVGRMANAFRVMCVRNIFKKCGHICTIGRGVYFGSGSEIEIGDDSGLGPYNVLPPNIKIGDHVMLAPEILFLKQNHRFDLPDVPIGRQGVLDSEPIRICDNVWIGQRVIVLPGMVIGSGSVVGAGAVVTKDVPSNTIVGGNPARVIRNRVEMG